MNVLLTQTILAAHNSEGDDTVWIQMLVIVILAVSFGIFSLAKAKASKSKVEGPPLPKREHAGKTFNLSGVANLSFVAQAKKEAKSEGLHTKREKDLQSGMEILDSDFLLSIVEKTNGGDDEKDVAMRKLNFKELQRRGKLNQADSKALKIYAINKGNLYSKDIQCEAIRTLAERTAKGKTGN